MEKYKISLGKSNMTLKWEPYEATWKNLETRLKQTEKTSETYKEYMAMSKDDQGKIKACKGGFVGGALTDGLRRRGHIACHSLITFDLDECPPDILDDIELMTPYKMIIYSTHKHSPESPRLRLILPLNRECSEEEYEPLARMVAKRLSDECGFSMDCFDRTTYEATRLMYYPTTSKDGEFIFRTLPGADVDVDKELGRYKDWHNTSEWPISSKEEPIKKSAKSKLGNPAEKKNIIGAFCSVFDVYDVLERYLYEVYVPGTIRDRYTFVGGESSNGAIVYDNGWYLFSNHDHDPAHGNCVNAFDLVRIHKFGDLDIDLPEDTKPTKRPSHIACEKWALEIPEVASEMERIKEDIRKARTTKAINDFAGEITVNGEREPWLDKLIKNPQTDRYVESAENYTTILMNDKNLVHLCGYNQFSTESEIIGTPPWKRADNAKITWGDDDDNQLYCYISKVYKIRKKNELIAAMSGWVAENAFDPVKQYIETAKWDGVPRIEKYFIDYLGADDNEYVRTVTRKMFVAAVARVYNPGCKFDYMVTLVGKQGIGKSYACLKLVGENQGWFQDSLNGSALGDDKSYDKVQGMWIVEIGELAALKKADREQVKLFISKQVDTYRKAFHKRNESYPRRCIFIGTTNDNLFINDATGGRRFLVIDCHGNSKKKPWDISLEEVHQLWAEAKVLYDGGEQIMDISKIADIALAQQEAHMEINEFLSDVEQFVNIKLPSNWSKKDILSRSQFIRGTEEHRTSIINDEGSGETVLRQKACVAEFVCEFQGHDRSYKSSDSRKINEAFMKLGWIQERTPSNYGIYGNQRGWRRPKSVDE